MGHDLPQGLLVAKRGHSLSNHVDTAQQNAKEPHILNSL